MRREFNVIIEKDAEGFYVGSVPQLKGCHSQAKSIDELMKRMTEAIELCLEVEKMTRLFLNLLSPENSCKCMIKTPRLKK